VGGQRRLSRGPGPGRGPLPHPHRGGAHLTGGSRLAGVIPSPNIWRHPEVYELENRSVDPAGQLDAALLDLADWAGRDVLDVGCGSGFHLPSYAASARTVTGVEPHPPLVTMATRRTRSLPRVRVLEGTAQALPLPPASVDVAHARWAYFFGPGCEPGLRELTRVVRRGGTAAVVDTDSSRSTFGRWFRAANPRVDPVAVERFWSAHGWSRRPVDLRWSFTERADLEAVMRIELDPGTADRVLAEHSGTTVDHAVNVWWRRF
jgi:SAM-dependent methyltransferase